ncbi:hypothetical protein PF010_g17260 [Phytophthora fragariae]|uniref:Uncharacterized protein n=2 Tax=Phytophthora TaxID=4783 RepID=A0A6G0NH82_9STRA|nr:hypothetical protein PR001_g23536 [Phytophthora rubi]KAE9094032.1 hypothetical protein PF010_g17260 [Phytophthora fragariae]KAE9021973.1 hypothetical protein PR002_g12100 [Phytophthora rubi]KAE9208294.1 hypothetical protein PF004_g16805 [Phytophthora fragariae]KAE9324112.1 hypothetical protein PF008_g17188 [Phytophthora fragariae]
MKAACRTEGFIKRRACIAISCGVLAPPPARLATCTSTGTTSAVVEMTQCASQHCSLTVCHS